MGEGLLYPLEDRQGQLSDTLGPDQGLGQGQGQDRDRDLDPALDPGRDHAQARVRDQGAPQNTP